MFSRSSSRRTLCDSAAPIANLDETIGREVYTESYETTNPECKERPESRSKPSTKEQFWSTGSASAVVENFHTRTLKMNCPISELVKLPPNTSEYIWIFEKAQIYLEECQLLWDSISDYCNSQICPEMTAGPHYTYLWTDERQGNPINMPACIYINNVFMWVLQLLNSDDFAGVPDDEIPEEYMSVMRNIFKKLYRVYAHVYHHHLHEFVKRNAEIHLNTSFKYFGLFVREFQLISKKEEAPLRKLLQQLIDSEMQEISSDE